MASITTAGTPTFKASGSCAAHSNRLSISRATVRIATSRSFGSNPALKRDID